MAHLRIGSRGSQLALWQANHISALLRERGHQVEIEIIKTTGDKITDVALAKVGTKGMFTKEIEEALAAGVGSVAVIDGGAGDGNELGGIAAVEGQFDDTLLIDHLGDGVLLRLHHAGVGGDLNLFRHSTDFHAEVDLGVVVDPEDNAALDVGLEPGHRGFEPVGADGQAGEGVDAVGVGNRIVDGAGFDTDHPDLGAGYQGALLVRDMTGHGSDGNGLCKQ